METIQSINLVCTNPHMCNGRTCIAGTSIEIVTISTAKVLGGQEPDEGHCLLGTIAGSLS
jgi:uncharacterized protein (DUF433 family)